MPNRSEVQAFLKSIGLHGWAESAEHLAGVEKVVEALGEPTVGMCWAGWRAKDAIFSADAQPMKGPDACWRAMWAARFRGE